MGYNTAIFVPPVTGSTFPPGPPSPVLRGNTIFVSKTGSSGGARQDVTYHFNTVNDAINVMQDGDIIIVYPGTYTEELYLGSGITYNIHLMSGAHITSAAFTITVEGADSVLNLTGNGVVSTSGNDTTAAIFINGGQAHIEADQVLSLDGIALALYFASERVTAKIRNIQTQGNGSALVINGCSASIVADYIGDAATEDRVGTNSYQNAAVFIFEYLAGQIDIEAREIRTRAPGSVIYNQAVGFLSIKADRIVNDFTAALDPGPQLCVIYDSYYPDDFVQYNFGQLLCFGTNCGYYCAYGTGSSAGGGTSEHHVNGSILATSGPAVMAAGNIVSKLYLNGIFQNSAEDWNTIFLGGTSAIEAYLIKIFLTGRVICTGPATPVYWVTPTADPEFILELITDCVIIGNSEFSMVSDNTSSPPSIKIYRLISNIPTDPDSIVETIAQSIVDPTVV